MRHLSIFAIVPLVIVCSVLTTGCAKKSELEAARAELTDCQEEKALAQANVISWQQRYDRESARWAHIEQSVAEAVPRALSEVHQERTRILELVPEQVKSDVSSYLDEYFNTVMAGFDRMARDSQETRVELLATQKALEALGQDTKSIGTAINESLVDEKSRRQQLAKHLVDVIELIVEFDQTRLNCPGCDDRLKMRDKSRADLLAFHQELMSDLSRLQSFADAPIGAGNMQLDDLEPEDEGLPGDDTSLAASVGKGG